MRFRTIWVLSGPFGCLTKPGAKRAALVQKFVPRNCIRIFCNERNRSNPLDPKLTFWCISYNLCTFGTVCCVTTFSSKRAKLVQKFVPRSRIGIFCNKRTRSTPLDPKLTFWCVSYYFWGNLVALRNSVQNVPNWCKSLCHEVASEFFARTHPIFPIGP